MRLAFTASAFIAVLAFAGGAQAEVASAGPTGFVIEAHTDVSATPDRAWRALTQLGRWWGGEHTYSGEGRRMRVDLRAGGCWCERWEDGQIEHGRVLLVMERQGVRTLRFSAALGPLQELAVNAVLTFTVAPHPEGARLSMTYRVSGDPALDLAQIAPLVDGVLTEQFGRLSRYSASGEPD